MICEQGHQTYQSRRMIMYLLTPLCVSRLFRLVIFQCIYPLLRKNWRLPSPVRSGLTISGLQAALETSVHRH